MSTSIIVALAAWVISVIGLGWQMYMQYWKSLDFFADIVELTHKDKASAKANNRPQEPPYARLYIANKGCPITIRGLFMIEGSDETQIIIDTLPKKLERGEVLQFYDTDLPTPIGFANFKDNNRKFYILDGTGRKYWMRREYWNPGTDQPKVIRRSS